MLMHFVSEYSEAISALANVGILLVWLVYAQLLYLNFSRQRKPKININQINGYDLESSECVISNLSQEPVQIECILLVITLFDHSIVFNVTEKQGEEVNPSSESVDRLTRQVTLSPGAYVSIGKIQTLLDRIVGGSRLVSNGESLAETAEIIKGIEIRTIADYGPDRHPVGFLKKFRIEKNEKGDLLVYPENFFTTPATGLYARYFVIPKWYEACTNKYFP
jgi:hypothetical protein